MYTLNDVQSSLLPELLHPDDAVLSVASSAKVGHDSLLLIVLETVIRWLSPAVKL